MDSLADNEQCFFKFHAVKQKCTHGVAVENCLICLFKLK